jgi:hypothetical protein
MKINQKTAIWQARQLQLRKLWKPSVAHKKSRSFPRLFSS